MNTSESEYSSQDSQDLSGTLTDGSFNESEALYATALDDSASPAATKDRRPLMNVTYSIGKLVEGNSMLVDDSTPKRSQSGKGSKIPKIVHVQWETTQEEANGKSRSSKKADYDLSSSKIPQLKKY